MVQVECLSLGTGIGLGVPGQGVKHIQVCSLVPPNYFQLAVLL